jgi:hypothetical protein
LKVIQFASLGVRRSKEKIDYWFHIVLDYDNPVCLSSVLLFYYHLAPKPDIHFGSREQQAFFFMATFSYQIMNQFNLRKDNESI